MPSPSQQVRASRPPREDASWAARLALALALGALGCASGGNGAGRAADATGGARILDATAPAAARSGEEPASRPAAAAEPVPPSSADRQGRLLIYSAITGHVPLDDPAAAADDPTRSPAEREQARAAALEAEISGELEKQEQIQVDEQARNLAPPPPTPPPEDPSRLEAPPTPVDRELPEGVFTVERVTIPKGEWQNAHEIEVVRRTLDADRDGRPEEIRYSDPKTGTLLRAEQDLDFDGAIDAWKTYSDGKLTVRVLDEDGDGRSAARQPHEDGRPAQRPAAQPRDAAPD